MSYLAGAPGASEEWEQEYGLKITQLLADLTQRQRMLILLSAGLVTGIEISNRLSINVILPDMQGNVAGSPDEISWVVILYNLGFLCSIALSSFMTRRLGTKRHLLYSLALYSAGALGCACSAHNLQLLLASRVLMGFGGGAFLVRTVILAGMMFPGKARIRAVSFLYLELLVFELFYPVTIGWISDTFHWNYAFLLDMPFLAIGAVMIWKFVPWGYLFLRSDRAYVDVWGAVMLVAGLSSLQIALSRGERDEWFQSGFIVTSLVIAVFCLAVFLWWDWRASNPAPVLHLRMIWRQGPLRTSMTVVLLVGSCLGAGLYVLPQYLRNVQNYSSTQTGGFISAFTAGLGVGLILTLRYVMTRIGGRRTVLLGSAMFCATCVNFIYVWTPTTPTWLLASCTFLQGFSIAPMLVGAANVATGQAALADLNDVSTSFFFVRQLGNTFGVTAATVLFDRRMTLHSSELLDVANKLNPTTEATLRQYAGLIARNAGAAFDPALGAAQLFQSNVIVQSALLSYIDVYFMLAVIAATALVIVVSRDARTATERPRFNLHFW